MIKILAYCLLLCCFACTDEESQCIQNEINTFKTTQADCTGASIKSYDFQGMTVYAFSDGQCISDGGSRILDEDCNDVCFIGGIAALTDCNGVNFSNNAELKKELWISE